MMMTRVLGLAMPLLLVAAHAAASVQISAAPTQNMNCNAGVCSPTSKNAVLNVDDLTGMLASEDVTITTGNGTVTIGILSPLAWASTHRLTLDAYYNVNIKAQVMVEGTAGLTVVTNDGGSGGDLMFYPGGKIDFWDTNSSLIINGQRYKLAGDLNTLKKAIHANLGGFYALAGDDDLHHKEFTKPPIREFLGTFEGLGNSIVNLDIEGPVRSNSCEGMFGFTGKHYTHYATIRDINLKGVHIFAPRTGYEPYAGALVGCNYGNIINASVDGTINAEYYGVVGGLVGANENGGLISRSRSAASVTTGSEGGAGGLVGRDLGAIDQSYAVGNVTAYDAGGLVGDAGGETITNCYATGSVTYSGDWAGGFAGGTNEKISSSYSIGNVAGGSGFTGGFLGYDNNSGTESSYWDLDTSGISDPSQGAGNIANDPGITGLTDAQLKSGLPAGFDPKIWAQSPSVNNGYPYLINNPPQ